MSTTLKYTGGSSKLSLRSVIRQKIDTPERAVHNTEFFRDSLRSSSSLGSYFPSDHQSYGPSSAFQNLKPEVHTPHQNKDIFVANEPNVREKDLWESNRAQQRIELSVKQSHARTRSQSFNHVESPTGSALKIEWRNSMNSRRNTSLFSIKVSDHVQTAEIIFKKDKKPCKKVLKAKK